MPKGQFVSCLKFRKMISKGCIHHLVHVRDKDSETPILESVPIVNEFPEVLVFLQKENRLWIENEDSDHLRIVFQVLKEQQVFSKFSKCECWLRYVAFHGYIDSGKGIEIDSKKTDAVKSWPTPLSPLNIQNFLGKKIDLSLHQRRWLELLRYYDMSVLYHPGKANVVEDALSQLSMGSITHVEEDKKGFVHDVHTLARLGVWLVGSNE
ncbi:hypothetical protein MTR67_007111, partial [Solanum verrucosum]